MKEPSSTTRYSSIGALLLISSESNELRAALLNAWEQYSESPRHSYTKAGRFIRFSPEEVQFESVDSDEMFGTLVLACQPVTTEGSMPRCVIGSSRLRNWALPNRRRMTFAELGRTAVAISMKSLYFLHHHLVGGELGDDERLAIAQHYGLPTALLDYTRSLQIAAFFATVSGDGSVLKEGDVGVIYYISPSDLVAVPHVTEPAFDFAAGVGIHLGRLRTIEPQLPDAEDRIARQKGLYRGIRQP